MEMKKNKLVRKRIIKVFAELGKSVLSTRDIEEAMKSQVNSYGERYKHTPTINALGNILKRHAEFVRTSEDSVIVRDIKGSSYTMATWELTEKGREFI
tara:strand:- start:1904 stop:2197 length:294 start_codon:yes stop_codon:yes gene_type:complete